MIATPEELSTILENIQNNNIPIVTRSPGVVSETYIVDFPSLGGCYIVNLSQFNIINDTVLLLTNSSLEVNNVEENIEGNNNNISEEIEEENQINIQSDGVIPRNTSFEELNEFTSRFSGAIWYENVKSRKVTLAGLGGIGGYVAFLLGRLNIDQLYIYDNDIVDASNMSGQFYSKSDIGNSKAVATAMKLQAYSDYYKCFAFQERFTENSEPTDIMICGFDSMSSRKLFFNKWLEHIRLMPEDRKKECLFIDGRLNMEELQVLCIRGNDTYNILNYKKKFLFEDREVEDPICSMKQTSFMANMIGSIIVNLFVNFCADSLTGPEKPLVPRDLPFFTSYNAEIMFFNTIS